LYELNVKNYTVIIFPVDKNGFVDINKFKKLFDEYSTRVILVSCISTNNEIGTLQPIEELIKIVKHVKPGVIFHSDCACNLAHVLKYEVFPDIITFSCYKFHGPHVGMLLTNVKMNQNNFGTPDVKNFYFASLTLKKYIDSYHLISEQQLLFKVDLKQSLYSAMSYNNIEFVDFDTSLTANNILSFAIVGIKTSLIQSALSELYIAIGSGSACTTNEGSHTVKAMGYQNELSQQLVRLSFNYVDQSLITSFVDKFISVVNLLKYIKKQITITQKIPLHLIVRPSSRKEVNSTDVILYRTNELAKPNMLTIQLSSGEQALKGQNKNKFNDILTNNIKIEMKKKFSDVKYKLKSYEDYHMLHLDPYNSNIEDVYNALSNLPGVSVVSPFECISDVPNNQNISECVVRHFNAIYKFSQTFSVRVKISGKVLEGKTNKDWEYYLGKTIQENFLASVDLENPDITIYVKGYNGNVYVGTRKIQGVGGLPCGTEGKVIFFVDKLNKESSLKSISKMYIRGAIPIVFTNDTDVYSQLENFLSENCVRYEIKLVNDESLCNELKLLDDIKHIACETNPKNILAMKQFGKTNKKYVFSNEMFNLENIQNESFFINNNHTELKNYNGLVLISGGIDSPVASNILTLNGLKHNYVHFIGNIDDNIGFNKIVSLVTKLRTSNSTIYFVEFGKLQEEIAKKCQESYRVMMYKIYMVLIANDLCENHNYNFIGMGNSLGQVASQTPQNLYLTDYYSNVPMLSPLIGMNKSQIIEHAKTIGTEEISKCNSNDCCVQFLPRNPVLNASVSEIDKLLIRIGDYKKFIVVHEHNI
jgi:adenylyl- and sulfurtransferase ThiI